MGTVAKIDNGEHHEETNDMDEGRVAGSHEMKLMSTTHEAKRNGQHAERRNPSQRKTCATGKHESTGADATKELACSRNLKLTSAEKRAPLRQVQMA